MLDIVYDGDCAFCRRTLALFGLVDVRRAMRLHDAGGPEDVLRTFPELRAADFDAAMFAVTPAREVHRGFFAFRRLAWESPFTWPLLALFYFPGASIVGPRLYAAVAKNRRRLGCKPDVCE